jgi:cryptochrome
MFYLFVHALNLHNEVSDLSVFFINRTDWFLSHLRFRFLLQCLEDLDQSLRRLNSRLFVIRGQPAEKLPMLFKKWNTTCLTFEEDPEPFSRVRDHNITEMCKELKIEVITAVSHTLYKLEK